MEYQDSTITYGKYESTQVHCLFSVVKLEVKMHVIILDESYKFFCLVFSCWFFGVFGVLFLAVGFYVVLFRGFLFVV